jgi:hypothetical protein
MITPDQFDWDDSQIINRIVSLRAQGQSAAGVAAIISGEHGVEPAITKDQMQKRIQSLGTKAALVLPKANPTPIYDELMGRRDVHKSTWQAMLHRYEQVDEIKVLILSDPHGNICNIPALKWALEVGADCPLVFVLGDLADWGQKSLKHDQLEHVPGEAEVEGICRVIRILDDAGKDTLMLDSNHDLRPGRIARAMLPSEFLWLFEDFPQLVFSRKCARVWDVGRFIDGWLVQFGDAIMSHPEVPDSGKGGSPRFMLDMLRNRFRDFHIKGRIRAIFCGHYHYGSIEYVDDVLLAHAPALLNTPIYSLTAHGAGYKTGQTIGCMTATFRKGKIVTGLTQLFVYPGTFETK